MGRDLLEAGSESAPFLESAEERLGIPLRRLMLEGPPPALQATDQAQPAILFHSLALLDLLQKRGVSAAAVAGHSLGEFAGLVAASALTPLDALAAVQARGRAMAASATGGTGMAAVLGLEDEVVVLICNETDDVVAANFNAPGQVVISGTDAGLERITPRLQQAGARRVIRLPVSAAFHSPLMARAAETFRTAWERVPLKRLDRPQVFNADAQVHEKPEEVRPLMVGQLTRPVRWTDTVRRLQSLGVDRFVEVGPGKTLTGLVKKILPGAVVHNIEDMPSLDAYVRTGHAG
ncbi:MAG: ACP S-malonyltransferase [Candidatus Dormibacteraeota bacterium]|nr:ACP S-malonyltransferase [Candidatus Dormibacteraeota bacterium]